MKFYNRETESKQLLKWSQQAEAGQSSLTLLVGRRRVGKTVLLQKVFQNNRFYYQVVS